VVRRGDPPVMTLDYITKSTPTGRVAGCASAAVLLTCRDDRQQYMLLVGAATADARVRTVPWFPADAIGLVVEPVSVRAFPLGQLA
jgi:hypothetical protein